MRIRGRWLGVLAGAAVVAAFGLAFVVPLIVAGAPAPPPPPAPPRCPQQPAQLAGRHFTTRDEVPGDLRCADLRSARLDGLDLSQRDFNDADLTGASLRHTDLTQADLSGAVLVRADLAYADLTQADLTNADLHGASLWLVGSIEVDTAGTRIGVLERGVVQLAYLPTAVAALLLLAAGAELAVPRLRPRVRRKPASTLALILVNLLVVGALWFVHQTLAALWTIDLIVPGLVTTGLILATAAVQRVMPGSGPSTVDGQSAPAELGAEALDAQATDQ
jgi:hypothetical protein